LFDEIAAGGMSSVHIGRMRGPAGFGRTVAIKRLHGHLAKDAEFVAMMIDEARVLARIHHPNVAATLDVVHTPSDLFIVMEYVPGAALSTLARLAGDRGTPIPVSIALAVAVHVLTGLDAAHEAKGEDGAPLGVVHRDVSPQNVLVGSDGSARLLDFGIARATGASHQSDVGQVKGKLAYMAPEQLDASPVVDRRTDVYAASVVLWEMLTGRRLFETTDKAQIRYLILSGAIRSPRKLVPSLSEELEEIVMRGLELSPEARFATAGEMATALERCGPIATVREVAAWVGEIAADEMGERARKVAAIERETASTLDLRTLAAQIAQGEGAGAAGSGRAPASERTPVPRSRERTRGRRRAAALATFALLLTTGALATRRFPREPAGASPVAAPGSTSASAVVATAVVPPEPLTAPSVAARLAAVEASSEAAAKVTPSSRRSGAARPGTTEAPRSAAARGASSAPTPQRTTSSAPHDLFDRN